MGQHGRSGGLRSLANGVALAAAVGAAAGDARGTVVTFSIGTPPGSFAEVTPDTGFGPELDLGTVVVDGGVVLQNFQERTDLLDDRVYATSDFVQLADDSLLPGEITAAFPAPVDGVRLAIQDWYLAAGFALDAYGPGDVLLGSDAIALDVFMEDPGDAGRLTVKAEGIARIVVRSLQTPGQIDFAIDDLTFESGSVLTNDTCLEPLEIGPTPISLAGSSRFAVPQATDPVPSCGTTTDGVPLWFVFTPDQSGTFVLDTSGSSYDTAASVWLASEVCGLLATEWACDDDGGVDAASRVEFDAEAGTSYRILVTQRGRDVGGDLALELVPEPDFAAAAFAALVVLVALVSGRRAGA